MTREPSTTRTRTRAAGRAVVSLLPLAAALVVIVGVGLVAERQAREIARQSQRAAAAIELEDLRVRLEVAMAAQTATLSRLAGTLAGAPDIDPEAFRALAAPLLAAPSPLRAVVAGASDGGPTLGAGAQPAQAATRNAVPAMLAAGAAGRGITSTGRPGILLTMPVGATAPGEAPPLDHLAALVHVAALYRTAGLEDAASRLDTALSMTGAATGGGRAVLYGSLAVLGDDPVAVGVAIPGGAWALAARPRGGWQVGAGAVWPIRLLVGLSICLIALPMLRTRRLMGERREHVQGLRDREARLEEVSHRLGLALDASRVAVWDYNIDRDELIWDARMDALYGYAHSDGRRRVSEWQRRLHPEDRARAEAEFRTALRTRSRYCSEFRIVLDDGHIRHIRAIAEVHPTPDGKAKIVGVNWDVSAEVLRSAELEARRAEAEAALAARSQFLATMSHEIRTPMNGVIGMLDLLLRDTLSGQQRERAGLVRDSAQHLLAIVNDVLDFSKLEADRIALEALPTDVRRMTGDVVALLGAANARPALQIFATVDEGVPARVTADPTRLRQVLTNLVGNAVKFTEAGTVEVAVGWDPRGDGILTVAVRDTGIGIAEDAKARIFERYRQADDSVARTHGGTGLGLAICAQLVARMGGEIRVDSVPGLGSTFSFWIPAPAVEAAEQDGARAPEAAPPEAAARVAGARILVAEDSPAGQQVLGAYLEMAGHDVTFAADGGEAVRALQSADYDLLIMDIHMPVKDGLTAAREIRALGGRAASLPIIALSGETADLAERARAAGMTDSIVKPVTVDALFGALERAAPAYSASTCDQPSPGSNASIASATANVSSPRSAS